MRALAGGAALLMLVVVFASAWLRLAQPHPTCGSWPDCRGAMQPPVLATPALLGAPAVLSAVRGTHRIAASAVLVLTLALVAMSLARAPRRPRAGALAGVMLALALGLAVLGIATPGSRSAVVLLGNLIGGQALLAAAWALVRELDGRSAPSAPVARASLVLCLPWAAQAALGALSGAGLAPAAPAAHLALALLVLPAAFILGRAARRRGCRAEGTALVAITLAQALLGLTAAAFDAAPALVLGHNVVAASGLALLIGLGTARPR